MNSHNLTHKAQTNDGFSDKYINYFKIIEKSFLMIKNLGPFLLIFQETSNS